MPAALRRITPDDLIPDAEYAQERKARRAALLPVKRLRRAHLGPFCTFYFESYDTMLFQVQEMLLTEKGGATQVPDELQAYNPLIPQGSELVATIMFEIEDPIRRAEALNRLGGAEDRFYVRGGRGQGLRPGRGRHRAHARGRQGRWTSSVHFLHFPLQPAQIAVFRDPAVTVLIGCDHEHYSHMAVLQPRHAGGTGEKDFQHVIDCRERLYRSRQSRRRKQPKALNMKTTAPTTDEPPSRLIDAKDQGPERLEGQDPLSPPRAHQAGRPGSGRGVEVERRSRSAGLTTE